MPDAPRAAVTGIRSDCNWYFGTETGRRDEGYVDPSPAVAAAGDALGGNLDFSYQDAHVAAWLHDNSLDKKREAAAAVLDMPGVIASYHINAAQDDYVLLRDQPDDGRRAQLVRRARRGARGHDGRAERRRTWSGSSRPT